MTLADKVMDHVAYPKSLRRKCLESLRFIIEDCRESIRVNPTNPNNEFYQDEINYALAEIKRREDKYNPTVKYEVHRNEMNDGWSVYLIIDDMDSVVFRTLFADDLGLATKIRDIATESYKLGLQHAKT